MKQRVAKPLRCDDRGQNAAELAVASDRYSDGNAQWSFAGTGHQPAHSGLTRGDYTLEAVAVSDMAKRPPRRPQNADELAAIERKQNDVIPGGLGLLNASGFGVECVEISLIDRLRVGERLQNANGRRHFALEGCSLRPSSPDEPPLGGCPLFRDELPYHDAGKYHHRQGSARGQQQEKRSQIEVPLRLRRGVLLIGIQHGSLQGIAQLPRCCIGCSRTML